jgi:hypothetical protein
VKGDDQSGPHRGPLVQGLGAVPGPLSGRFADPMYGKAMDLVCPDTGSTDPFVTRKRLSSPTLSVVTTPPVRMLRRFQKNTYPGERPVG